MKKVKFSLVFLCVKDFSFVELHVCFYVCRKGKNQELRYVRRNVGDLHMSVKDNFCLKGWLSSTLCEL
jgi:hypothetical protein